MNIKYKIDFYSDWHCGSGLAAGADVDALVIQDENDMPFIPGKTLKGLIREAVVDIRSFAGKVDDSMINKAFGYFDNKDKMEKAEMFFSNAVLENKEYQTIVSNKFQKYLYRDIASTAIDDGGIAVEHSLRKIQVVVPCTLYAEILDVPDDFADELVKSLGYIKRMGVNRNRGLGRCSFSIIEKGGNQ